MSWCLRRRTRAPSNRVCTAALRPGRHGSRCSSGTGSSSAAPRAGRASRRQEPLAPRPRPFRPRKLSRQPTRLFQSPPPLWALLQPLRPQPRPQPLRPLAASAATREASPARISVLAKPPVRKLAKELGVDLSAVAPYRARRFDNPRRRAASRRYGGHAGRRRARARPTGHRVAPPRPRGPREERIAVRGVRKHTAAAVAASAFTAPHVTEFLQVDVTATMEACGGSATCQNSHDIRVSPLLFVAKALLLAVARNPMINSSWDDAAQEIVVKRYVNLGIAAATDRGPHRPEHQGRARAGTARARPRDRRARRDRQGGQDHARRHAGRHDHDHQCRGIRSGFRHPDPHPWRGGDPGIRPGQGHAVGAHGELAVRKVCTLAFSFDHRIVDGDLGSAVLRDVGAMLEDPIRMLAWT